MRHPRRGRAQERRAIAARACADPELARATHEKLLHFLGRSEWDDRMVRHVSARHVIDAMVARGEPVTTWVIDDTGFLKQGSHSVGVQRQYTGSAGKIANCQIGVSLSVATRTEHQPIDFELYLPECWTEDSQRRSEAHIPDAVRLKTKTDLALDMITRAVEANIPGDIVLADSAYGDPRLPRDRTDVRSRLRGRDPRADQGLVPRLRRAPTRRSHRRSATRRSSWLRRVQAYDLAARNGGSCLRDSACGA